MSVDDLLRLVPPPAEPLYPGTNEQWREASQKLGITFPADYISIKQAWGAGDVLDETTHLYLLHAIGPNGVDVSKFVKELNRVDLILDDFDELEYHGYDGQTGLFPLASDSNGKIICWNVASEVDSWEIVTFADEIFESFPGPTSEFLVQLFRCELDSHLWYAPFFADPGKIQFRSKKGS